MVRPYINTPTQTLDKRDSRLKKDVFSACHAVVEKKLEKSSVINLTSDQPIKVPRFDRHEIVEGKVIGRGGFAVIREIKSFTLEKDSARRPSGSSGRSEGTAKTTSTDKSATSEARESMAEDLKGKNTKKKCKYVLKELDRSNGITPKNQNAYMNGVVDMAMEAQYLAHLNHPHILTLRGISTSNQFGGDDGMFLVLEYLPETLSRRLNVWMQTDRTTRGVTGLITGSRGKAKKLLLTRVRVAHDIAGAMNHLHSKQIIFRDLKPDNLGFNAEDQIKLFDFGLAKELHEVDRDRSGLYRNMTGFTGAIRYMAPEVGKHQRYNLTADVYSMSMLLWHMMALEPPLGLYTPNMMLDRVFTKGHRPYINEKWPEAIQDLLRRGWNQDIKVRPSMDQVTQELRQIMDELESGPKQ